MSVVDDTGSIAVPYQNFIALSRYARWLDAEGRRETWVETVDRYVAWFRDHLVLNYGYATDDPNFQLVREAIINLDVMPSMRALMTAGPALSRSHIAGYNCSFIAVDDPRAFDEAMYILLNGTGVGFSVEHRHVDKLPPVPEELKDYPLVLIVEDSKEGWALSFRDLLTQLWQNGIVPRWDLSNIRAKGERLKTFGGRASGPGPLDELFRFTVTTFKNAAGRRLTPLECHDLMCKVGDVIVSGGVRRSALISLSDLGEHDMAKAKSGNWWEHHPHRRLANNSAAYGARPSVTQFLREWRNLIESQSGERGIFNMNGARAHAAAIGRDGAQIQGTNPCGEILLRDQEFCNLTEVVIKADDTIEDIRNKVHIAAIIGTWQSTLTDFPYLRDKWRENCEDERLLGVSLTGIYGHRLFNNPGDIRLPKRLRRLRQLAAQANQTEADKLGINPSAAITCVKPSGTVSQLTGVSSGIHPWHSEYYIRTVRAPLTDPMTSMLRAYGVPNEPDLMAPDSTVVFSWAVKAPPGAVVQAEVTALEHLALWSIYREHWTDHNPSVTISVAESEWLAVGTWVFENWERVGGVSFLPRDEHTYQQAPYQKIDAETYEAFVAKFPQSIYWSDLGLYELMDSTTGGRELACAADGSGCDVVDIVA